MILQNLPPPLSDDQRIPALEGLTLAQVTPRLPLNSPTSTLQTLYARSRDGDQIPYQRAGVWHVAIHNPPETYNAAFQRRDYQIVELRVDQFAPYVIKLTMRPDANGEVFAAQLAKDTPSIADYVFPIVAGWLLGPNLIVQIVGQTALNGGDLAGALKSSLFGVAGGALRELLYPHRRTRHLGSRRQFGWTAATYRERGMATRFRQRIKCIR
jgi:hypothetical protein